MMAGGIIIVADMGLTSAGCCSNSRSDAGCRRSIFIFSRAGCEAVLRRCLRDGIRFIDEHGADEVETAIEKTLADYPSIAPEGELNR